MHANTVWRAPLFAMTRIDMDGDGTQDMQIVVAKTGLLSADDFLL